MSPDTEITPKKKSTLKSVIEKDIGKNKTYDTITVVYDSNVLVSNSAEPALESEIALKEFEFLSSKNMKSISSVVIKNNGEINTILRDDQFTFFIKSKKDITKNTPGHVRNIIDDVLMRPEPYEIQRKISTLARTQGITDFAFTTLDGFIVVSSSQDMKRSAIFCLCSLNELIKRSPGMKFMTINDDKGTMTMYIDDLFCYVVRSDNPVEENIISRFRKLIETLRGG